MADVLIPGANSFFQALLQHNARVYIACRSETKANEITAKLTDECEGKLALYHPLDLADLSAIKASAQSFLRFVLLTHSNLCPHSDLFAGKSQSCTSCSTTRTFTLCMWSLAT